MTLAKGKSLKAAVGATNTVPWITLNAQQQCDEAALFEEALFERVVAQHEAIHALSQIYQVYLAQLNTPGKPLGTLLFLGPTGCGKTRSVEAAAEVLFHDPYAMVRINCGEFQHSHEIAKLIGSPPGYLGHRETQPMLTQENLERFQVSGKELTFVLFDEIEKASDALWQLLLGILDKAMLTLGDNRRVDFSDCIIVMTSNLGAREMSYLTEDKMGFSKRTESSEKINAQLDRIGVEAARRKFSPEFMNRLDKVVVFHSLQETALRRIIDIELEKVQQRIYAAERGAFVLSYTPQVKDFLLHEGFDKRYGARPLKRAIERHLVIPLSNLIATRQVGRGDCLLIDLDEGRGEFCFRKSPAQMVEVKEEFEELPQAQAPVLMNPATGFQFCNNNSQLSFEN